MDEPLSSELLAKYLAGEASAKERVEVEAWAGSNAANAAELDRLRSTWGTSTTPRAWDVDRAWTRVTGEMDEIVPVTPIAARRPWHTNVVLRIAAAVVLMAGVAYGWREYGPGSRTPSAVYATTIGERRTVDLADGTHVIMGPMSELRVAHKYNRAERRVDLTGEAWFEVKHDSTRSFQVHALGTVTEDLGTAFSVRAITADSVVHVIVAEGVASVRMEGAPIARGATLQVHDVIALDVRALKASVAHVPSVDAMLSWRTGHVEFNEAPFSEVAAELKRWYGVTARYDRPSLLLGHVSYSMPTDNLNDAIAVLATSLGVKIEHKGDTLFVR